MRPPLFLLLCWPMLECHPNLRSIFAVKKRLRSNAHFLCDCYRCLCTNYSNIYHIITLLWYFEIDKAAKIDGDVLCR